VLVDSGYSPCIAPALPAASDKGRGTVRSALVAVAGGALLAAGLIGLLLPVPGVLLIAMGLSILSTRFAVARRWRESLERSVARLRAARR
jgi:hypothetical protein